MESQKSDSAGESASGRGRRYTALGVVFSSVGLVFLLTMESAAMGIPFLVLGLVFFSQGVSAAKKSRGDTPPGDANDKNAPRLPSGGLTQQQVIYLPVWNLKMRTRRPRRGPRSPQ